MATTDEDLAARVAALEKVVAERPTREEVEQIVEKSREELPDAAVEAIESVVEAIKQSISESQQSAIGGVQQVVESVRGVPEKLDSLQQTVDSFKGVPERLDSLQQTVDSFKGLPEKLDNLAEKVNRLSGAYDLGKWVAAIILGGIGYGIYHISDKLSEIITLLGKLAEG